jgi:3-oxoacyl-[acyl-carrier-protein] synthase-1
MIAALNALGLICALGKGKQAVAEALFSGNAQGMCRQTGWVDERSLTVGAVTAPLPAINLATQHSRSRNNQLLLAAALEIYDDIQAAIARYGAGRIAVVLGTSTSGIAEAGEHIATYARSGALPADYHYARQEMVAPANFLADWLGLGGPSYCQSSACTSSARALLSAQRLLRLGICDAVLCGGVDSLCKLTLKGFASLEAVADERCNPFSANRNGINIGEAAALFLMTRAGQPGTDSGIALYAGGASSDAYHISAPHPQGRGAQQAMRRALGAAGLKAEQISYLNLHGTATVQNDAMESLAVQALFPQGVACSSSKPLSGHTLGAAGALEAAFCWLTLSTYNLHGRLPPHLWDGQWDPALPRLHLVDGDAAAGIASSAQRYLMSNSFAFGGNNLSLILGDLP